MKPILAAAAIFLVQPAVGQEPGTTGAILNAYGSLPPVNKEMAERLAFRTFDGIKWADAYLVAARKEQGFYCPPDAFAPTGAQVLSMVKQAVARKPWLAKQEFGLALLITLQDHYPCTNSAVATPEIAK
jgi:hypothetical protein